MTDQAFEARVERVLRRYAETAVRPIDAVDVAQRSMVSRVETFPRPFGMSWLAAAAIVAALLLAAMLVVSGGSRWPALFDGRTTPTESPASPRPLAEDLFGPWQISRRTCPWRPMAMPSACRW